MSASVIMVYIVLVLIVLAFHVHDWYRDEPDEPSSAWDWRDDD